MGTMSLLRSPHFKEHVLGSVAPFVQSRHLPTIVPFHQPALHLRTRCSYSHSLYFSPRPIYPIFGFSEAFTTMANTLPGQETYLLSRDRAETER